MLLTNIRSKTTEDVIIDSCILFLRYKAGNCIGAPTYATETELYEFMSRKYNNTDDRLLPYFHTVCKALDDIGYKTETGHYKVDQDMAIITFGCQVFYDK